MSEEQRAYPPETLTIEEIREDLVRAGYGDLIAHVLENYPQLTEAEAIEHLHSFY